MSDYRRLQAWKAGKKAFEAGKPKSAMTDPNQIASSLDICACGHTREEHPDNGPCSHGGYHQPKQCMAFRLSATSAEIAQGFEEWSRIIERDSK